MSLQIWSWVLWAVCAFPLLQKRDRIYVQFHTEPGNTNQHAETQKSLQRSRKLSFILGKVFRRACCSLQWAFRACHLRLTSARLCAQFLGSGGFSLHAWMHNMQVNVSQNKPKFSLFFFCSLHEEPAGVPMSCFPREAFQLPTGRHVGISGCSQCFWLITMTCLADRLHISVMPTPQFSTF